MSLIFGDGKVIIYENILLQFIVTIQSVVGKKMLVKKTRNPKRVSCFIVEFQILKCVKGDFWPGFAFYVDVSKIY